MDKNLRNIFQARYKAVLLFLVVGFFALYAGGGFSTVKGWNFTYDWLNSDEFKNDFNNPENNYTKGYDEDGELLPYLDIEEYQLRSLVLFNPSYSSAYSTQTNDSNTRFKPDQSYERGHVYWSQFAFLSLLLIALCLFLLSFALFFIDSKTNFNAFLFSLSYKKKEIFRAKLLYLGIPVMTSIALGIIIHQVTIYLLIPDIYVNATLGQMLYSGLTHWVFLLFTSLAGSFLGVLLGNLVTAPLMIGIGILSLSQLDQFSTHFQGLLELLHLGSVNQFFEQTIRSYSSIAINHLDKTGATFLALLLLFGLTILLFLVAEKIYENTSLESNGKVLTVPRYRRRFFVTLAICTSLYYTIAATDFLFHMDYYGYLPLGQLLLLPIICTISSFIATYYDEIFKFWNKRYLDRMTKKIQ